MLRHPLARASALSIVPTRRSFAAHFVCPPQSLDERRDVKTPARYLQDGIARYLQAFVLKIYNFIDKARNSFKLSDGLYSRESSKFFENG